VAAQRDGRDDRIEFARTHLATIEGRLAKLTVDVPARARAPGLAVTVDGATLGEPAWGLAMPIDPGRHLVAAEAPGKRPFSTAIDVSTSPGVSVSVDIPALADGPPEARGADATASGGGGSSARGTIGWVVGGLGVASLGVASYFGLHAFSRWADRNAGCTRGCTDAARSAGDDASAAATISTFGFGVGVVALGVGAYLVLSASRERAATHASLGGAPAALGLVSCADGAGLCVRGAW
jgi:hypothetical protein